MIPQHKALNPQKFVEKFTRKEKQLQSLRKKMVNQIAQSKKVPTTLQQQKNQQSQSVQSLNHQKSINSLSQKQNQQEHIEHLMAGTGVKNIRIEDVFLDRYSNAFKNSQKVKLTLKQIKQMETEIQNKREWQYIDPKRERIQYYDQIIEIGSVKEFMYIFDHLKAQNTLKLQQERLLFRQKITQIKELELQKHKEQLHLNSQQNSGRISQKNSFNLNKKTSNETAHSNLLEYYDQKDELIQKDYNNLSQNINKNHEYNNNSSRDQNLVISTDRYSNNNSQFDNQNNYKKKKIVYKIKTDLKNEQQNQNINNPRISEDNSPEFVKMQSMNSQVLNRNKMSQSRTIKNQQQKYEQQLFFQNNEIQKQLQGNESGQNLQQQQFKNKDNIFQIKKRSIQSAVLNSKSHNINNPNILIQNDINEKIKPQNKDIQIQQQQQFSYQNHQFNPSRGKAYQKNSIISLQGIQQIQNQYQGNQISDKNLSVPQLENEKKKNSLSINISNSQLNTSKSNQKQPSQQNLKSPRQYDKQQYLNSLNYLTQKQADKMLVELLEGRKSVRNVAIEQKEKEKQIQMKKKNSFMISSQDHYSQKDQQQQQINYKNQKFLDINYNPKQVLTPQSQGFINQQSDKFNYIQIVNEVTAKKEETPQINRLQNRFDSAGNDNQIQSSKSSNRNKSSSATSRQYNKKNTQQISNFFANIQEEIVEQSHQNSQQQLLPIEKLRQQEKNQNEQNILQKKLKSLEIKNNNQQGKIQKIKKQKLKKTSIEIDLDPSPKIQQQQQLVFSPYSKNQNPVPKIKLGEKQIQSLNIMNSKSSQDGQSNKNSQNKNTYFLSNYSKVYTKNYQNGKIKQLVKSVSVRSAQQINISINSIESIYNKNSNSIQHDDDKNLMLKSNPSNRSLSQQLLKVSMDSCRRISTQIDKSFEKITNNLQRSQVNIPLNDDKRSQRSQTFSPNKERKKQKKSKWRAIRNKLTKKYNINELFRQHSELNKQINKAFNNQFKQYGKNLCQNLEYVSLYL